jgi:signal transduction histidine kinase
MFFGRLRCTVASMSTVGTVAMRARQTRPEVVDRVVACALLAAALALELPAHLRAGPVIAAAVTSGSVALRRPAPKVACALVLAGTTLYAYATGGSGSQVGAIAVALDYYLLGHRSAGRRWDPVTILLIVVPVPLIVSDPGVTSLADVISVWLFFGAIPFSAGRVLADRAATARALSAAAAELEREQAERARSAAAEERTRIAREVHDIVAHSVSVMVIQAVAARSVADRDSNRAREALVSVETCGREALGEMRRMMGVLRRDEIEPGGGSAPGLAELETLAARARASGLAVDLRIEGTPYRVPPGIDLAGYRVVQEALTNTIKHAGPVRARVRVRYAPGCLELEVADAGRATARPRVGAPPDGKGLVGMRERVSLCGGELRSGRRRGGGFRVSARIPIAEDPPS